ncbi:hypothetical protein IMPERIA75_40012 [Imperialibacter sp. 75]|nr:hypothetical protein IMPERIA75_40012 [Imperialibacter sp. 75]
MEGGAGSAEIADWAWVQLLCHLVRRAGTHRMDIPLRPGPFRGARLRGARLRA